MCERLNNKLGGSKFIIGDKITLYDVNVAGFFVNIVLNPQNPGKDLWAKAWESTPENIKTYVANFQEAFKEYLANRRPGSF